MTCRTALSGKLRYTAPLQLLQLLPNVNPVAILIVPLFEEVVPLLKRLGDDKGFSAAAVLTGIGEEVMNLILSIL